MNATQHQLIAAVFKKELTQLDNILKLKHRRSGKISEFNDGQIQELRVLIKSTANAFSEHDPGFNKNNFFEECGIITK